jgi:hypothetical protein
MRTAGFGYLLGGVIFSDLVLHVVGTPILGFQFEKIQGSLPILKFPYQSYRATNYSAATDVSPSERIDLKIMYNFSGLYI